MIRSAHGGTGVENGFGLKEMITWVNLPRDFTKSCFKNTFQQRYRDVVRHVS
jgi:hypothetical protein